MKRNISKFAAALLFASVAITCSLTMWASPPAHTAAGMSKTSTTGTPLGITRHEPTNPVGTVVPEVVPPFDMNYSLVNLGFVPGVITVLRWSYIQV